VLDPSTGKIIEKGDDPFDQSVWIKSNPNLNVSVSLANLEAHAAEAKAQPGKQAEFMTKLQNIWCSAAAAHINIHLWRKCNGVVDLEALRSEPCYLGFDLASVSDLTSLRLIWWVDGRLKTYGLRYLPEAAVEPRTVKNSAPYRRWAAMEFMGRPYLTVTEGDVVDYRAIEKDIRWAYENFDVRLIGFDRYNSQDLVNRLTEDGLPLLEVRQGYASLSGAMKELDRVYLGGLFDHGGDEVLTWCASNVVARTDDNDNMVPSKKKSSEKIDDYSALLNAIAVSLGDEASPYSDGRELLVI
jgi:phage terminase large subunit-like protein